MVMRALATVLALAAAACAGSEGLLLDLCAPPALDASARATLDRADEWVVLVFGMYGDSAVTLRSHASQSTGEPVVLSTQGADPREDRIRIVIQGFEGPPSGAANLRAIAGSGDLALTGGEEICLCVAPPEAYGEACMSQACTYSSDIGCSFQ
jgi:hypothetical protein